MSKRRLKNSQSEVDKLANETWSFLNESFGRVPGKRPPVYLFLSPESKGSLSRRSPQEIKFVHDIQANGGGVSLTQAPLLAYVSQPEQSVEETAHLYAIKRQKTQVPLAASTSHEKRYSLLHEAFGEFVQCLLLPRIRKPSFKVTGSLWDQIHSTGYLLGRKLAEALYDEQISFSDIRAWLNQDWHDDSLSRKACRKLKTLCVKKLHKAPKVS